MNDTSNTKAEKPSLKGLNNPIAWQYKQTFLIQLDDMMNKYYNNEISKQAII